MVQFFKGSEDPRDAAYGQLSAALGQGLGNGLTTFFANRSLNSVLHDKALESAPVSEKLNAVHNALSPYGEKGQQFFQNIMQNELLESKRQDLEQARKDALEKEKRLFQHQKELQKLKNEKKSARAGESPIPPEQIAAIDEFIKNNPNASADELAIGLGKAGVNPTYSNPYVENRRGQETNLTKQTANDNKIANASDIKFHEESKEYADKIRNEAKLARQKLDTIEPIIKDVQEGKIKPTSTANIFRFFGDTGNRIADALLTGKEANLLSAIPEFLEGRKELFGVRLSDADLRLLADKLPDISKSPEANLALLNLMKKYAQRVILRQEAAESVLQEKGIAVRSGKLRPLGYENAVENKFMELQNEEENGVLMRLPDGREVPIERNKVKEAESLGATRSQK